MTAVEKVDWFCPKCNSYVSSESVTFEETHQICNTRVILEHLNKNKMTPKEKAKELILKLAFKGAQHEGEAKNFALIAIDEILKAVEGKYDEYWQQVKQEIINL